jgi:hypothetical protein
MGSAGEYAWRSDGTGSWQRRMEGTEQSFFHSSPDGVARFMYVRIIKNMMISCLQKLCFATFHRVLTTVLLSLDEPLKKDSLSSLLKSAWLALYYQVPNMTFVGVRGGLEDGLIMKYDQITTTQTANNWLATSYTEEHVETSDDPNRRLFEAAQEVSQQGFTRAKGTNAYLNVVYFTQPGNQLVKRVGFVLRNHHMVFDGTGTFTYIDRFLHNVCEDAGSSSALSSDGSLMKASPEKGILEHIREELFAADRSAKMEELKKVVKVSVSRKEVVVCMLTATTT